ncbi:MAG TPA: O-antigen ligase family protein [Chthoniobacterales bacterium]|nr:O-antigen ligase family protein [Chthoniobacterales bacterium]
MKPTLLMSRAAEVLSEFLLGAAFAVIQVLIGGTRLLFSLPAYGLLALLGLLAVFPLRRARSGPSQICLASSMLFFGYVLARALLSPGPYIARPDIYSVLGGLIVYFFVACIFTGAKQRMMLILFLLAVALVHVLIGAVQFRAGHNFMPISFLQRYDYGRRASGFYVCPNHLAGLLEVLGVFGLSIVCWSRSPAWVKLLTAYAISICYLGLVLTGSRGGYLSATASLVVFASLSLMVLRRTSGRLFWKVGGASAVIAIMIGLTVASLIHKSDYLSGRAQNIFEKNNIRVEMWKAAIQQWRLQPLFGTGSGTYLYYGRMFRTEQMQKDPVYVHNDYLQLLAEYGVIGGALFLLFLGAHIRNGWRNFQRLGPKRVAVARSLLSNSMALNVAAIAAVSAYTVHSFVDFNLHIPANVLLLAFVFGILANAGTQREEELSALSMPMLAWRLALPIIGVTVAIQCVRLLPGEYFAERARTALRDDHLTESIVFAQAGLTYEQENPNLYDYLGNAQTQQADSTSDPEARALIYEAALSAFQNARTLAPQDSLLAIELGSLYDTVGRFSEAEWMWNEALRLDPRSTSLNEAYQAHLNRWRNAGTSDREQTSSSSPEK